jgi:hypothetical protein
MEKAWDKIIEFLERNWHKPFASVLAPLFGFVFLLWYFYSNEHQNISELQIIIALIGGLIVFVTWILTNRLPKVKAGNVGIVVCLICDSPEEDKQVKLDFVANLRLLSQEGGSNFQLVEIPNWALSGSEDHSKLDKLLAKVRGHFLIYGRVRMRNKDGKPAHILAFDGMVRHRPTTPEIQKQLAEDFTRVFPKRVVIEKENDVFSFEATSEWTDVSTRYVIGTAALISGDVAYAENLFRYVEDKLHQPHVSNFGIKEISRLLPQRFRQLYSAWIAHLYSAYFSTRDVRYLKRCDEIATRLLVYDNSNYGAMMIKAICEFIFRRDVSAAHKLITKCRNDKDWAWWYSRAFLHAYQGKMDEALSDYRHAFAGPIVDKSVPVQCEEFIQIVIAQEPDRIQLHFCSGLINFHAKEDYIAAERDFDLFLASSKSQSFPKLVREASDLINKCKQGKTEASN